MTWLFMLRLGRGDRNDCVVFSRSISPETEKELRHSVLDTESTVCLDMMASKTVDPESSSG